MAAVVIGDAGDDLSYRNMDVAFRLVHGGAELLAMHRNPWWLTPRGIDARRRGVRGRPRVRDRASRADARQAVAGRLPPGGRRARGGPRRAVGRGRPSRWSATIRGPTWPPPSASGCAVCSSCPARRRPRTSSARRPPGRVDAVPTGRPDAGGRRRRARLTATFPRPDEPEDHADDDRLRPAHQDHLRDPGRRQRGASTPSSRRA